MEDVHLNKRLKYIGVTYISAHSFATLYSWKHRPGLASTLLLFPRLLLLHPRLVKRKEVRTGIKNLLSDSSLYFTLLHLTHPLPPTRKEKQNVQTNVLCKMHQLPVNEHLRLHTSFKNNCLWSKVFFTLLPQWANIHLQRKHKSLLSPPKTLQPPVYKMC